MADHSGSNLTREESPAGGIRVPRPRVAWVRRSRPGQASPGDEAEARVDAGLIALLSTPLGAGFHPLYNVPLGLSGTAAVAVVAPATPADAGWVGRDVELEWQGAPGLHDAVVARARLLEFSGHLARFSIEGRTAAGDPLYRGTLGMTAVRAGYPAGFASRAEYDVIRALGGQGFRAAGSRPGALSYRAPEAILLGRTATVEVEVCNLEAARAALTVAVLPLFGAGLSLDSAAEHHLDLAPGERARVAFQIRADRPHAVNLGKPWDLEIAAGGETLRIPIRVPDPDPGRIFYLLTEDCETFDGGPLTGDYSSRGMHVYGNCNNMMDPEEYRVQMIRKPDRLNEIADRHGARWTHFYTATQRFGAEWAARQSPTGEWNRVIAEMDASVRTGSRRHEYCPHIHFDYEPDSALPPQPRLLYDRATDGILPNDYYHPKTNPTHRYHDWDGTARDGIAYIKTLGDWTDGDSKTGSLRKTLRHLARLQANRQAPAVARTGSFDFGKSAEDQATSTQAYLANGLRGNSDAYRPGGAPAEGGQMFWCSEQDCRQPVAGIQHTRLVQFGVTMDTFFHSADEMNRWFASHQEALAGPGVHALVCMTHAMFCAGAPDPFRSLEGGAFEQIDRHLAWVREHYPRVEFATATEALLEYLDYYTPVLDTYTDARLTGGDPAAGRYEFAVRLLGRGIRVDEARPATVRIAAPPCFSPEELAQMRVVQAGCVIVQELEFDARRQPVVCATLTSRAPLRLEVDLRPEAIERALGWFRDDEGIAFYDPPESREPDLFRVRRPEPEGARMRIFSDTVRLLMNPVAGHPEPLGRRSHPLGGLSFGAALTAAFRAAGEESPDAPRTTIPGRVKLRWVREVDLQSSFVTETQARGGGFGVRIYDDTGTLVAHGEVGVTSRDRKGASDHVEEASRPASIAAWERDFHAALATYRSQRAWSVMLAVRKVYDVLARGTWKQRIALLGWIPRFLMGRAKDLKKYDLHFPDPPRK